MRASRAQVLVGLFFVVAGGAHFTHPDFYRPMMPPYLPRHLELIYASGAFEIMGGLGLLIPRFRRAAGWGLIALLVAVFPANIHIVLEDISLTEEAVHPFWMWVRLPLQALIIGVVASVSRRHSQEPPSPESTMGQIPPTN
jgi:uncharacterized membrane protein